MSRKADATCRGRVARGLASSVRQLLRLVVLCVPLAAFVHPTQHALAQPAGDTADMAERVQACAACHGAKGGGTSDPYFPRLAGKPAGYLYNQLIAFRNGRRRYPPMNYLLEYLTPEYLLKMAEYYAAQRPPPPPAAVSDASKQVLAQGEDLVTHGDAARGIPACMSCHGVSLTGMEPGIPGLLGLRATYVSAQLGAWRYGNRTAIAPDCMQVVAGHLTEDDVHAVAAFLSSRPVPADTSSVPKDSYPLPFACGSQPK
jgi:cytochrome c553